MSIRYFLAGILLLALPLQGRAQYKLRQAAAQESLFNYAAARSLYAKVYKKKQSPAAARALAQIYREIDALEPAADKGQEFRPVDEWFWWPLSLAALMVLVVAGRALPLPRVLRARFAQ